MPLSRPSSDRFVGNRSGTGTFPVPLTSFIGRSGACSEVATLLRRHRLVTLTGSGGCGKSRLALQVATEIVPRFDGRGIFVDLSPLESGALVANSLAAECGVSDSTANNAATLTDLITQRLADARLLLVLDNCDAVVDACAPLVHQLLSRCGGVAALATGRAPLGVDGEVTYRVPGLTVPRESDDPEAALRGSEAGELFLDRARCARPDHHLDRQDASAAISVCRRLDGIPLAIELAAGRLRVLDVADVAEGLSDHFRVLGEGPRTAPVRQRTLEASMNWSHQLLDDLERRLFRRLGGFCAAFSAESAAAVCGGPGLPPQHVLGVLWGLVDRSLVQLEDRSSVPRYRLLDAVREYALARLDDAAETELVCDQHLDHHLALAQTFASVKATDATLAGITESLDDLRAAMTWSARSDQVGKGLRIAAGLRAFWISQGRIAEGRDHFAVLLDADAAGDTRARASALVVAAMLADYAADPARVRELGTEALELGRACGDRLVEGQALSLLGWAAAFSEPPAAESLLTKGFEILGGVADDRTIEFGHVGLAVARTNRGDLPGAASALFNIVEDARARDTWALRFGLGMLGWIETLRARFEHADHLLREAVASRYGAYTRFNEDLPEQWLALLRGFQGDYETSAELHDKAIERTTARGDLPAIALLFGAMLDLALGDFGRATARASTAAPAFQRMQWKWFEARSLRVLGDAAEGRGDIEAAESHWHEAGAVAAGSGSPVALAVADLGLARAAAARDDVPGQRRLVRAALRRASRADHRLGAIDALEALALLAAGFDRTTSWTADEATMLLAAVDAERHRIGYVRSPVAGPGFAKAVEVAREHAGATFEHAWEEGTSLSPHDAATLAARGDRHMPRPASGWASLTPSELRVTRLVADGLTNPQIAERLFVSPRTVQTHLSRVFAKLDLNGRAELAAAVGRRDLRAENGTRQV